MRAVRLIAPVLIAALAGCATPTERALLDAQDDIEACDLRAAHEDFGSAYDLSEGTDSRASLGYALTDLILLVEDPNITALAMDIGFDSGVDAEDFVYGDSGLFHMLATEDQCDAREDWAEANIPWQPVRSDVDPLDLLDDALTVDDLLANLTALRPRFERTAQALEDAADTLEEPFVIEMSDTCGTAIAPSTLQAPELYAAASILELGRTAILIAEAYTWSISITTPWMDDESALTDRLNTMFHDPSVGSWTEARVSLVHAIELADKGLLAVSETTEFPENGLFDWTQFNGIVLTDMRLIGAAALESLESPGMVTIPMWEPGLDVDLNSYFSSPPDAGNADPLFIYDGYVEAVPSVVYEHAFAGFSRNPTEGDGDEEWNLSRAWEEWDVEPVFNPGDQFDDTFECEYNSDM